MAIALRLGTDAAWREEIRQRIAQNAGKVFGNGLPVKELEQYSPVQVCGLRRVMVLPDKKNDPVNHKRYEKMGSLF